MDALKSPTLPAGEILRGPTSAEARPTEGAIASARFDELIWTFRGPFQRILTIVPASAWAAPQKQPGWVRVKENARREVWRVEIAGASYYLKYFFREPPAAQIKHWFRPPPCVAEWNSGQFAARHDIPAVRPLGYTMQLRRGPRLCSLLISEAAEKAIPLNEFWRHIQADDDSKRGRADAARLIDMVAEMIARAHQAGFEHLDMHAENILVQTIGPRRYRALFVDLQSSRQGIPIQDRAVVRNLAQLNQWFGKNSSLADRLRFLRSYFRWRNEYETAFPHARPLGLRFEELVTELMAAAQRHAQRLWRQRDRRVFRSGSYFKKVRLPDGWRGFVVARCKHALDASRASAMTFTRDWWTTLLRNPLRWFTSAEAQNCKNSHSASVRRAVVQTDDGPLPVIIKRPLARNWRRWLTQLLSPSRSRRAWQTGHALLHRDLPTARPLAMIERRLGPLTFDSLIISEGIPGATDLESYLRREQAARTPPEWAALKRQLLPVLAAHARRLRERGIAHRDCKASNILIQPLPTPSLFWIDMDGLRVLRRSLTPAEALRPLVRLYVSLREIPGITRADLARFLRAYLAGFGTPREAWRIAWRELSGGVDAKLRAQVKRRAWKLRHYGRI